MVVTLFSWGIIAISAFLCGFGILQTTVDRKKDCFRGIEVYFLFGLCFLTVYAQAFSLFFKVSAAAVAGVGVICLIVLILFIKPLYHFVMEISRKKNVLWCIFVIFIIGGMVIAMTVRYTAHYDTDLYHAQNIRWIEEFGVVKGLGNLHNRFAYNSAFLSLQALFSLKFAVHRSLHTMNGFIALIMLSWAITTLSLFRKHRPAMSDVYKLGIVFYFFFTEAKYVLSSPGSDVLALSMVLYLAGKWSELMEENCKEPIEYGLLCLLAVWAVTVKLSVGMLVLLAVYPAALLLHDKNWKGVGLFLGAGLLIAIPFLSRNIVISGYLLYPYEAVDLFDVDWKMPASICSDDRREIAAWGRGMNQRENYDAPPRIWLPVWYGRLEFHYRVLVWINIVCLVGLPVYMILNIRGKAYNKWPALNLILASCVGLIMWFAASPLIRYGVVWLFLMPAFFAGLALEGYGKKIPWHFAVAVYLVYGFISFGSFVAGYGLPPLVWPEHYNFRDNEAVEWNGMTIYIGNGSDSVGYHNFPGTTGKERLELIELRGSDWKEGFRTKEEYRDKKMTTSGVLEEDML